MIAIFTSPTTPPRVAENEYRTFTVGVTHFVSLSSLFLGLISLRGLLSKDSEDSFGGMTELKPGKERVVGEVLLSLTVVCLQSMVENGGKVRIGGGCRRDGGHGVIARGE